MTRRLIDASVHKSYIDALREVIRQFDSLVEVDPGKTICAKYCTFEELVKFLHYEAEV